MPGPHDAKPCTKCKTPDAQYRLRNLPTCSDCFTHYVKGKIGRRIGAINRDSSVGSHTTTSSSSTSSQPPRYLAGLSFGASSAALTQVLDGSAKFASSRGHSTSAFVPHIVHVDTDLSAAAAATPGRRGDRESGSGAPAREELLDKYRERYPNVSFECVHLSKVLDARTLDWSLLPAVYQGSGTTEETDQGTDQDDVERLRRLFDHLPSLTAKADVLRLLVRHLLLHLAVEGSYAALLLGHNTTTLASLTLSEVANGRGFSVPAHVGDGPQTVCLYSANGRQHQHHSLNQETSRKTLQVYYPVREVLRGELSTFLSLTPALAALVPCENIDGSSSATVVSHKDMSIDQVTTRYFESVEGPYAGIVTNVVRTAGKLDRAGDESGAMCGLCGMTLDELGDSRWAGELGEEAEKAREGRGRLCYGCKRSVRG